jgi:hypothetical protein
MNVDLFLHAIIEFADLKKDYLSGNVSGDELKASSERVSQLLTDIVDERIEEKFEQRRRHQSQERIQIADSINATMKHTTATIRSISALNSAPPPPPNQTDANAMKLWREQYDDWYQNMRKKAMEM